MMIETEAKFIIPNPATFNALKSLEQLGSFQFEPLGAKTITDRYLDTANRRFMAAGYAFRLRQAGARQIATLKSLTPASGGVHRRLEFEAKVNSELPQTWPAGQIKDLALDIAAGEPPELLFVIRQKRYKYKTLLAHQPVIEFSLDEVYLSEAGPVDYLELEAELIEAGTEEDLQAFVAALQADWPLKPEHRSKFERALCLLSQPDRE